VSLEKVKRHPTLEDGVIVGAGAKLLGAITVGQNARIGANAVVIKDVAPGQVVVGFPGRSKALPGDQPPVLPDQIDGLMDRLNQLEQALLILKTDQRETIEIDYTI
jgi:serine O-acetyltransferase